MTEDCVNDAEDYQEIQSKTINPPYATKDDFISGTHSRKPVSAGGDNTMKERQTKEESTRVASLVDYSFERPIKPEQLQILFRQTGWADDRSLDGIQKMLDATYVVSGHGKVTVSLVS